ncbi:putative pentatricopeptide repeat-containing protein At2g01510 [Phalaenopsis equestris]|uniref:putative pentatricopeptide repeat-containing protein At2g01510 n=1 Tax=Phalaenopsis equestris TaxID=78828 RepID=UPI0009E2F195|nr:putative pentatricopeptide repeat-containing protein At2g01510 [Phalaenopsis equestris]
MIFKLFKSKISQNLRALTTLSSQIPSPKLIDADAIKTCFHIEIFHANQLIESLLHRGNLPAARKVFDQMPHRNTFTSNRMISGYAKSGHLDEARKLFNGTANRTAVTWTIMIGAYSSSSRVHEAFELFREMSSSGIMPDRVTIIALLSSCQDRNMAGSVVQIHGHVLKFGFDDSVQVLNTLVDSYCKSGLVGSANKMFEQSPEKDSVTYNAMMNGFAKDGFHDSALELFEKMRESGLKPSQFTFSGVLVAASGLDDIGLGLQTHGLVVRTNFQWNVFVINSLLDFYSKSYQIDEARYLFDEMSDRDNISYNVMISCYAWSGLVEELSQLFQELQQTDLDRKLFPFPSLLSVAGSLPDLETGRRIHAQIILAGAESDDMVTNALIDMYFKCGEMEKGKLVFLSKSEKNTVSWTAIITGYIHNGLDEEALRFFSSMRKAGISPDRATFSSILSATATLALLVLGKQIHSSAIQLGISSNVFVGSALLDMYAKCGCLDDTHQALNEMPVQNIVTWNAMITAYGQNGSAEEAMKVFDEMLRQGIKPDSVTYLSILSACSHNGFVEQGLQYFRAMEEPRKDHYACAVDLLGRVGRFDELESLLNQMPFDADEIIWNSVLNSCRKHRNEELAAKAAEKLFAMELSDAAPYIIMSNIYSQSGRWNEAAGVKKMMRERGVKKERGCSWVEIKEKIHVFSSDDERNPRIREIRAKLEELEVEMEKEGYRAETSCSLRNVGEEGRKAEALKRHSERLAIGYALISTPAGSTVRVMKNLRACVDCHEAIKVMSKIVGREIVVRDTSRFHHFKQGVCSCGDYW